MTALHLAAEKGHCNVVNVLLSNRAFVNAKSKSGLTPLHIAAKNGFKQVVLILIQKYGAAIDALTLSRKTPLHVAAKNGKKDVCKILLYDKRNPADLCATDSKGQTPLHLASKNDHSAVVKLFLKTKSDETDEDIINEMKCAHVAAKNGSLAVIKEMMRYNKSLICGFKMSTTESTTLHLAAQGGHLAIVKVLVDAGASPNEEDNEGQTCIHLAARYGHLEVLSYLKSQNNLTLASLKTGMTPLHVAAQYGQIEVFMDLLIEVPVNIRSHKPNPKNYREGIETEWRYTALHLAAQNGHEHIVRLLLNCDSLDIEPMTAVYESIPIHLAAKNGHVSIISLLLSKSASQLSKKDSNGTSVLHIAASYGHLEMTSLLIGQGAEINSTDNAGLTPLHLAAKSGHLKVTKYLVESGAICDLETNDSMIPLIFAAHYNHTDVMSFLLRQTHSTVKLMTDSKFLYDLMICSKINDFKSIDEFVLLSSAPAETAAKLSKLFKNMSFSEKERSKDLLIASQYCENMCADLVSLAALDNGADKLLKSVDYLGIRFLDILIQNEQKEVISHPAIQSYLSDIWRGGVNWPNRKLFLLFVFFICCPFCWLSALTPSKKRFFNSPMIKFFNYLISHFYLISILMFLAILDVYPCHRKSSRITCQEWLFMVILSGQLVSELINPADRKGIGVLKIVTLVLCSAAIFVHMYTLIYNVSGFEFSQTIYFRNQILATATFTCLLATCDFFSINNIFGPWAIIIRSLASDVLRFIVAFLVFMVGFSCMGLACLMPQGSNDTNSTFVDVFAGFYFTLFGLVDNSDPLSDKFFGSLLLSKIVLAGFLMINMTVLINLLIAMMTETYERIHDKADLEWKFGRSKLIRNLRQTTAIPAPFILISQTIYYCKIIILTIRNIPMPDEDDYDDNTDEYETRQLLKINESNYKKTIPDKIEDIVEWQSVVMRYIAIRTGKLGTLSYFNTSDEQSDKFNVEQTD